MLLEGERSIVGGKKGSSNLLALDPNWLRGNDIKTGDKLKYVGDYKAIVLFKDITLRDRVVKFVESLGKV